MRRFEQSGRPKPHKLILLLAVVDLVDAGSLVRNQVYFDDTLKEAFRVRFVRLAGAQDWCQPGIPYFYLRTQPFWNHKVKEGRSLQYALLKKCGGGSRRIVENIEYAYFSDYAWRALSNPETRKVVRDYLLATLESELSMAIHGIAFHETFYLKTKGLAEVLRAVQGYEGGKPLDEFIHKSTSLGTRQAKAFLRYAKITGLLDDHGGLARFGELVFKHDQNLARPETLWLLHYHLCAPHRGGPAFWGRLVRRFFRLGSTFSTGQVAAALEEFVLGENRHVRPATLRSTARVFVGSYAKDDGLGGLGILRPSPTGRDHYEVAETAPPPWRVFVYGVADYWQGAWGGRKTAGLEQVTGEGGPASIFLVGSTVARLLLREAQREGLLQMHRAVQPYQVERFWESPEELLERVYE